MRLLLRSTVVLLGAFSIALAFSLAHAKETPAELPLQIQPDPEWGSLAAKILYLVDKKHYRPVNWYDRKERVRIYEEYIEALDSTATLLSQKDKDKYLGPAEHLLTQTLQGDFSTVVNIYNLYLRRWHQRIQYQISILDKGMPDLTLDDQLLVDREDARHAPNDQALKELWSKLLRNNAINLFLQEDDITAEEVVKRLKGRLDNSLKRLERIRSDEIFQTYINTVLRLYDPHTSYLAQQGTKDFEVNMSNSLEGIGALLRGMTDYVLIEEVTPGGPAQLDGRLQPGDHIIGVGQGAKGEIIDVSGWHVNEVVQKIRGPKGTTVLLKVLRDGSTTKEIALVRDTIKLESQAASSRVIPLSYRDHSWKIGVITLPSFYQELRPQDDQPPASASSDIQKELDNLKKQKVDAVLLDLRYNSGGSLEEANKIAGLFLGRRVVVQIQQRNGPTLLERGIGPYQPYQFPLGVMINPFSASASEIVAAAIQDYASGIVIGQRSHGKGTVQDVRFLGEGLLRITFAKFFRISGESTQRRGVIPDVSLPTLIDTEHSGERQYPTALPWNTITPVYQSSLDKRESVELAKHNNKRIASPRYTWLTQLRERLDKLRNQKSVVLNLQERRMEQQADRELQLSIENQRATINSRATFEDFAALEEWRDEQGRLDPEEREDHELDQALRALLDHTIWLRKSSTLIAEAA